MLKINISLIFLLLFCFYSWGESRIDEYRKNYSTAIISNDTEIIENTLSFIDKLIDQNEFKDLSSIYYNKAQLLNKLKRTDEAIEALEHLEFPLNKFYQASLLVRIGQEEDATSLFDSVIDLYITTLKEDERTSDNIRPLYESIILAYILADRDQRQVEEMIRDDKRLSDSDITRLNKAKEAQKDALLQGLWP